MPKSKALFLEDVKFEKGMMQISWDKLSDTVWESRNGNLRIRKNPDGNFNVYRVGKSFAHVAIGCDTLTQAGRVAESYWMEQA